MGTSPIELWKAFLTSLNRLEQIDARLGEDRDINNDHHRKEIMRLASQRIDVTKEMIETCRALRDSTSVFEDVRDVLAATYGEDA